MLMNRCLHGKNFRQVMRKGERKEKNRKKNVICCFVECDKEAPTSEAAEPGPSRGGGGEAEAGPSRLRLESPGMIVMVG